MLKQEIKSKKQEEVDKNRSPFLVKFFKKHPYKEYRDKKNRLVLELKDFKLVQVLNNEEEDKQHYIEETKDYINFAINAVDLSQADKNKKFDYSFIQAEITHKNYNNFPMFFVYDNNNECLGTCGYRDTQIIEHNGKQYELQEISCRLPKLVSKKSLETKIGNIILLMFDYAEKQQQKVSFYVYSTYLDTAFHLTDVIKNLHFNGKKQGSSFLTDTIIYSFDNLEK